MDRIEVYHAGTDRIEHPTCNIGRARLDFGQGFYITDIYDQAYKFALSKSRDRKMPPLVNVYILNRKELLEEARALIFDSYDDDWLEFIAACRSGNPVWTNYDYIEGGIADDRVIDTVNMYIQGYMTKERALHNLRYLKPNNQICITNQTLLDKHLVFSDCLKLTDNELLR